MQKKWMIGGVIVLGVAGALPWAVGYVTEQQWQQATLEVNNSQPFVQLETEDYRRGYLGSELTGSLLLVNPETGETFHVGYHGSVSHGITGSLLNFEPEDGWAPEGSDWFPEGVPVLTLETRLWGRATVNFHIPATRVTDPDSGDSVATTGGQIQIEISDAGRHVQAQLEWQDLTVSSPDFEVRVAGARMQQSMDYLSGDIWTGTGDLNLASVAITSEEVPPVSLQGISLLTRTEASDSGKRMDSQVTLNLETLTLDQDSYGPHHIVFALNNLDVASWNDLSEGFSELQNQALSGAAMGSAGIEQQIAAMNRVSNAARNLAAAGFSIGFPEVSLATPEGEVTGDMVITHPELSADEKAGMLMVMQRLTGTMNLSMPVALAENYPDVRIQVAPLIKEGLMIQEGDQLEMKASMKDMQVDVNGVVMPLPPIF